MSISTDHNASRSKGDRILSRARGSHHYAVRLAKSDEDLKSAQTLRFVVFNLELNEGLEDSFSTLLDADKFDSVCDHLLVEDTNSGEVVGTYRLQTGLSAKKNLGFYSAQEFDFSPYEKVNHQIIELGRACVRKEHRNLAVLGLLWRGIVEYAKGLDCRYLIGCSSLSSQDTDQGILLFNKLKQDHLVEEPFQTNPLGDFICKPSSDDLQGSIKVPKLLSAYLAVGAKICGPPAIDREFKTIDLLTFLDLKNLNADVAKRLGLHV